MNGFKLDKRDIKILSILQKNGRITKAELAKQINLSPTPCWERLKRLEQIGVIESYGAVISPLAFGAQVSIFLELELEGHKLQDFDRFENYINNIDEILDCWAIGGGLDYILRLSTRDVDGYQRLIDRMLNEDVGIKRYYTYIVTKKIKETKNLPASSINIAE
ncbi:MAG: Lrp/AsnC family transcriptional regulator [Alphaproteobacteria bacterium]|nr:Lrp/AsnC family transcriptional regulator [Alphaproteobacteria bacterium]